MYDYHCPSLPTCISNSVILRWRPKSCCWRAVFYPLRAVICCWIRLFSAFWKLKCLFLIFNRINTFLLRSWQVHLIGFSWHQQFSWSIPIREYPSSSWVPELLFCGYWVHLIYFWFVARVIRMIPRVFGVYPWGRLDYCWSSVLFNYKSYPHFYLPWYL